MSFGGEKPELREKTELMRGSLVRDGMSRKRASEIAQNCALIQDEGRPGAIREKSAEERSRRPQMTNAGGWTSGSASQERRPQSHRKSWRGANLTRKG